MLKTILILSVLTGCTSLLPTKKVSKDSLASIEELENKVELYLNLLNSSHHRDKHGFINTEECDATFSSGLLYAALNDIDNFLIIRDSENTWHRRPNHDCGPSFKNSRSTISRDMMMGVFYYLWFSKDLDTSIELMDQLKSNIYYLPGDGTIGELLMTPVYLRTLSDIIIGLKGIKYPIESNFPAIFGKDTGYIAHLTMWHIALRGFVNGKISSHEFNIVKYHYERSPKNPLFTAIYHKYFDGNQQETIDLLLDNDEWPNYKLPTSENHCDNWPITRDYNEKDWGPCTPIKEHSGAELIIIYNLFIKGE